MNNKRVSYPNLHLNSLIMYFYKLQLITLSMDDQIVY